MTNDVGRAPSGQALVSDEAGSRLHPSGFDPSHILAALEEVVYVARNASGRSQWHRLNSSRPFDYEDFCVWVDHWELTHPVVTAIAALQDRDALLRADEIPE
jgi:hypothetical protein